MFQKIRVGICDSKIVLQKKKKKKERFGRKLKFVTVSLSIHHRFSSLLLIRQKTIILFPNDMT